MSGKTTKLIFTDMKKIIFTLAVALIALHGTAQETNFSLRPAVKVEKSVTNKFSLQLAHQTRYYTDLNEFERFSARSKANTPSPKIGMLAWLTLGSTNIR